MIKIRGEDGSLVPDPFQQEPLYVHLAIDDDGGLGEVRTNMYLEDAIVALQRAQLRLICKGMDEDPELDESELIEGDAILRAQARATLRAIGSAE